MSIFTNWNSIKHLSFPPPHSLRKPPFNFLLLWMSSFCVTRLSGILTNLSFCIWIISLSIMSSKFTHVVADVKSPPFSRLHNVPFYVYPIFSLFILLSMDIEVVSTFWQLWMMLLRKEVCKYLLNLVLSITLSMYSKGESLAHTIILCLIFWGTPILFYPDILSTCS